jgi:hypothetical protein
VAQPRLQANDYDCAGCVEQSKGNPGQDNQSCQYLLHNTAAKPDALPVRASKARSPLDTRDGFQLTQNQNSGRTSSSRGRLLLSPFIRPSSGLLAAGRFSSGALEWL